MGWKVWDGCEIRIGRSFDLATSKHGGRCTADDMRCDCIRTVASLMLFEKLHIEVVVDSVDGEHSSMSISRSRGSALSHRSHAIDSGSCDLVVQLQRFTTLQATL